jgi:hypothetical protein
MSHARVSRVLGLMVAACVALVALGCARNAGTPVAAPAPTPGAEATTPKVISAVKSSGRADIAAAQETALAYIDALRSRDASQAASLMTSYRRAETRAKGWKSEIGWWRSARVTAVMHPGRYLSDERTFAQLYAEQFGHPPYKLVVLNVSYGLEPGTPPGDTDFVVTQDSGSAPWLVHDFGGALRPRPAPALEP